MEEVVISVSVHSSGMQVAILLMKFMSWQRQEKSVASQVLLACADARQAVPQSEIMGKSLVANKKKIKPPGSCVVCRGSRILAEATVVVAKMIAKVWKCIFMSRKGTNQSVRKNGCEGVRCAF